MSYFFTSESVSAGHPDKVCDRISDSILDELLKKDPNSKVAVEALCSKGFVQVAGQVSTNAYVDIANIVRESIKKSGYRDSRFGFDGNTCGVNISIDEQSTDITNGVFKKLPLELGAGDQGTMFGYACSDTSDFMSLSISIAHALTKKHYEVFNNNEIQGLGPDAKSQVTVEYLNDNEVKGVEKILFVTQHLRDVPLTQLRREVKTKIVGPVLEKFNYKAKVVLINPSGKFVSGGPVADTGLTGRKIIVDTYGGAARHGGGAFSGKDPSKVDRSATYALRQIAKSIVANKYAKKCEVQASYALGISKPLSLYVNTYGTATSGLSDVDITKLIESNFDLRPGVIIKNLGLKKPIYTKTSNFGHFGGNTLPWEKIVKI